MHRRAFVPDPLPHMPRWLRNLALALLLLLLLLVFLVACHESTKPESLAASTLVGPRLTTGPICVEEAVDVSGSMAPYRAERERAERELFTFARRQLRSDDRLAEAFFAGSGVLAVPLTSLSSLQQAPAVPNGIDYTGTLLGPAVDTLVSARRSSDVCAARALVLITDGELFDDVEALSTSLTKGNYTRIFAVIPSASGWGRPSQLSGGMLDSVVVHHFHEGGWSGRAASILDDAKPLDVIFGDIIGSLTGQRLARSEQATNAATLTRASGREVHA